MSIEMADVSNLSLQTPTETRQGSVEEDRMREKARSAQEQVSDCDVSWLTYLSVCCSPSQPSSRHPTGTCCRDQCSGDAGSSGYGD